MDTLNDMRKSIDNIDNAIIAMLSERFKVTNRVGHHKAKHNLAAKDLSRESEQYERIQALALHYGLDQDFAKSYLSAVIKRVIQNHEDIAEHVNKEIK